LNVVCTSKPCDGLLYYSYEYCSYLNSIGIKTQLIIIPHPGFNQEDYFNSITSKYISYQNVTFDPDRWSNTTLIMGRSMLTIGYLNRNRYSMEQLLLLHLLFKDTIVAVYSENHPIEYENALEYFCPYEVIDICDYDVYPNGVGEHFEKRINFDIYRPILNDIQFKYLFNGTNKKYYDAIQKVIKNYKSHGILVYDIAAIDIMNNNIIIPIDNLLGIFETYVYTKPTFDPAPRIIQECKYFNKNIEYVRDKNILDGGSVYFKRDVLNIDINPILKVIK
jgi:hypothetical protein